MDGYGKLPSCYGSRKHGRLAECATCEWEPYCRGAGDPALLGGPNAGPTGDDAAYEAAIATTPDEHDEESHLADRLGEVFAAMAISANWNSERVAAIVYRALGLSMEQIGALHGMTRQAVHKGIGRIQGESERIGEMLRQKFAVRIEEGRQIAERMRTLAHAEKENGNGEDGNRNRWGSRRTAALAFAAEFDQLRRERPDAPLCGDAGLYGEMARRWELPGWDAARTRIKRARMAGASGRTVDKRDQCNKDAKCQN